MTIRTWVETLRSGKYKQGTFVLRDRKDKFCCLGVLCDIVKDQVNLDWEFDGLYSIGNSKTVLPTSIVNFVGTISQDDGRILISKTNTKLQEYLGYRVDTIIRHTTLIALNDYYRLSFDQIADILEEEFLNENKTTNLA